MISQRSAAVRDARPFASMVFGVFKGMGDLLSAAAVIRAQLDAGTAVAVLCFANKGLGEFAELIDFGARRDRLRIITLPVGLGWASWKSFVTAMREVRPEWVWVSPHAPAPASSWKLPWLLWMLRAAFWPKAKLAGASSERCAFLFDVRVSVDRDLPLVEREETAFAMATCQDRTLYERAKFVERISAPVDTAPRFDLLIHPGANAQNRSWPFACYAELVDLLPAQYRIAVLGLPSDIEAMRETLPADRGIAFLTGNLERALGLIAQARLVLTMDSGNVHFASVLGTPVIALFGKSDPRTIIRATQRVLPVYEKTVGCQPCQKATCHQPEVYCMKGISADRVAKSLLQIL